MGYPKSGENGSGSGSGLTGTQESKVNAIDQVFTSTEKAALANAILEQHSHSNKAILDAVTAAFTVGYENKLAGVEDRFKGIFNSEVLINIEYPNPSSGWGCWNSRTSTIWGVENGLWVDTGSASFGDMLSSIYDPQSISADTFNRANHTGLQAIDTVINLQTALNAHTNDIQTLSDRNEFTDYEKSKLDDTPEPFADQDGNKVKVKVVYGTFPDDTSDFNIEHGISTDSVVVGFSLGAEYNGVVGDSPSQFMPPNFTDSSGYDYQAYVNTSSVTVRQINSVRLQGRACKAIIWYITP